MGILTSFPRSRQDKTAILGKILPIFCSFSAYGTPSAVFKPTCLQNSPISIYFPSIFRLKWYPSLLYKLKHGTHLLFFRPHVYGFCLFSAHFPPIFCLTFCPYFAGPVLPGFKVLTGPANQPWPYASKTYGCVVCLCVCGFYTKHFSLINPFHPTGSFIAPKLIILNSECIFNTLKCCFDCLLCKTRREFYVANMLRSRKKLK